MQSATIIYRVIHKHKKSWLRIAQVAIVLLNGHFHHEFLSPTNDCLEVSYAGCAPLEDTGPADPLLCTSGHRTDPV